MIDEHRTRKEFIPYNEYVDRGMSLKWGTAFELGEVTQSINKGKEESGRNVSRLTQQSAVAIDSLLDQSIKYNRLLSVQLNTLDELGRIKSPIMGTFIGFADWHTVIVGDALIDYDDIRNVSMYRFQKWSAVEQGPYPFEPLLIDDEMNDYCESYFDDGEFVE